MDAPTLLHALRAAGLTIELIGTRLRISPADRITDEQRAAIKAHKLALIVLLAHEVVDELRDREAIVPRAQARLPVANYEPWDQRRARELVDALYRRVNAVWSATPAKRQSGDALTTLAPYALAIEFQILLRDLPGVRRAIAAYEEAAGPVLPIWCAAKEQTVAARKLGER